MNRNTKDEGQGRRLRQLRALAEDGSVGDAMVPVTDEDGAYTRPRSRKGRRRLQETPGAALTRRPAIALAEKGPERLERK